MDALLSWLTISCNATIPRIAQISDGTRGIVTLEALAPHQTILRLPQRCLITDTLANTDPSSRAFVGIGFGRHVPMAVYMLKAMADKSHFFQPYFATFPARMHNYVTEWNATQLALLDSSMASDAREISASWQAEWDAVGKVEPALATRFSFADYRRVKELIQSRVFSHCNGGTPRNACTETAMVPLADLFNHAKTGAGRNTDWKPDMDHIEENVPGFLQSVGSRALHAGDVLFDSYGDKSQARALLCSRSRREAPFPAVRARFCPQHATRLLRHMHLEQPVVARHAAARSRTFSRTMVLRSRAAGSRDCFALAC